MLSEIWYVTDIDDFGLWVLRLCLAIFGFGSLALTYAKMRHRIYWQQIPFGVRLYSVGWTTYWSFFAIYILLTNDHPFGDWFRTLYGTGYLGMLTGGYWCLWCATREPEVNKTTDLLKREVIRGLAARKGLEDVGVSPYAERVGGDSL